MSMASTEFRNQTLGSSKLIKLASHVRASRMKSSPRGIIKRRKSNKKRLTKDSSNRIPQNGIRISLQQMEPDSPLEDLTGHQRLLMENNMFPDAEAYNYETDKSVLDFSPGRNK